ASAAANGAISFTGTGSLVASGTGNRTLTLAGASTGNNTLTSVIPNPSSGSTSLTKAGAGTWVLGGANSFSGPVTISQGILSIATIANGGANSTLGASAASTAVMLGGNGTTGTLQFTGASGSSNRTFTLATGGT